MREPTTIEAVQHQFHFTTQNCTTKATLQERFEVFHLDNPWVYRELVGLLRIAQAAGVKKSGIGRLFEKLRWDFDMKTRGEGWKLNNSYRSRYARLIDDDYPDLGEMLEMRVLKSK